MRDFRKRLSTSMDHLHDLVFDRLSDETDSLPFGGSYNGIIYREGYLFKQSRKMWKLWKTRYFVLRNDGLFYFRSIAEKEGRPLGVISLKRLSVHLDAINDKGKPKYCLRLGSGNSFKTFYCLCCFSNEERNLWFTSLLTAISQNLVSSCNYTLKKSRSYRSSSGSSSDSVLSDPLSSPSATLNSAALSSMPRTASCEFGSLFRVTEHVSDHKRPTSLSSLSELNALKASQTLSPKKTKKSTGNPLRKLKALSSLDGKGWRGSYIDLSA